LSQAAIHGLCDARFVALREAFAKSFAHGEVGAAVAVCLDGRLVVDLWGGYADAARRRPWRRDTLVNVYSTTKGLASLCVHRLVEAGKLDLEAPVAHYWPGFAQQGKEELPVRYLLTHQAGLPIYEEPLRMDAFCSWSYITLLLEAQEPLWEPGTRHGYHALTFGHLVGELVRRVDGRSIGTYLREEVTGPCGVDFHIGLTPRDQRRCAEVIAAPRPAADSRHPVARIRQERHSLVARALGNPRIGAAETNSAQWRSAEIPAANGHGDARGLARIYGALATAGRLDGYALLGAEATLRARSEQVYDVDAVLEPLKTRFGLGFFLGQRFVPFGPNRSAFGHPGSGGSFAFADPETGLGFAYVMNQLSLGLTGGLQGRALVDAAYRALGFD